MLVGLGLPALKVSSGELTNLPYLREMSRLGVVLLVSTGMGTEDEVEAAVEACADAPASCSSTACRPTRLPSRSATCASSPRLNRAARHPGRLVGPHARADDGARCGRARGADPREALHERPHAPRSRPPGEPRARRARRLRVRDESSWRSPSATASRSACPRRRRTPCSCAARGHAARALAAGAVLDGADLSLLRPEGGNQPGRRHPRGRTLSRDVPAGAPSPTPTSRAEARLVSDRLTVAVFVGTRADLGPLTPVLEALEDAPDVRLRVLTGVMYAADDSSRPCRPRCRRSGGGRRSCRSPSRWPRVTVDAQLEQGARLARASGTALRDDVDVLVVLGDRWELLYVVPPAVLLGVPVVHLQRRRGHRGRPRRARAPRRDEARRPALRGLPGRRGPAAPARGARRRIHVTGAPGPRPAGDRHRGRRHRPRRPARCRARGAPARAVHLPPATAEPGLPSAGGPGRPRRPPSPCAAP